MQGLKDKDWSHVEESIANFDGEGKSIDYDEDDFERYDEGDIFDCEYETKIDPSTISFYFGDKIVTFDSSDNSYVNKKITYTKENIIDLVTSLTES